VSISSPPPADGAPTTPPQSGVTHRGHHLLELADRARRLAEADEAEALAHRERSGLARFASSQVHQPTLIENESVLIRVVRDGRVGTAATNRTDDDGLRAAARRAEAAADAAPPDPGFPGLAPEAEPPAVEGWDPETAALAPEEQARLAWRAIEAADGYDLFGFFTSGETELAVVSTTGLAVAQTLTDATILALAASESESGYAAASSWRAAALDPAAVARKAVDKAGRTRGARELEPGAYRAVLEPEAFSDLLFAFGYSSLNGLALIEERSYLSGRLGEQVFHESLTLLDDGRDPRGLPKAFDFEGVPKEPVTIVEKGVARDVVWDRRTAARAGGGQRSTGHALPAPAQGWGPMPLNLVVRPGDATIDELIERVGDGIHVTRLHYLSVVDGREGIITGMTRDGTFRVEGGELTDPLVNLRFTTSFPELLRTLLGLTRETTLVSTADYYDDRYPTGCLVPGVATETFTVIGTGSAPGL
jgi:predicted Zn-dependent protease